MKQKQRLPKSEKNPFLNCPRSPAGLSAIALAEAGPSFPSAKVNKVFLLLKMNAGSLRRQKQILESHLEILNEKNNFG